MCMAVFCSRLYNIAFRYLHVDGYACQVVHSVHNNNRTIQMQLSVHEDTKKNASTAAAQSYLLNLPRAVYL